MTRLGRRPNVRYLLESGEFPLVASFVSGGAPMPPPDFELGLEWLLDGLKLRCLERPASPARAHFG